MKLIRFVVAAVAVVGCSADHTAIRRQTSTTSSVAAIEPSTPPTAPSSVDAPANLDTSDPRPLVSIAFLPYAIAPWYPPISWRDLVLYPDGTIIQFRYETTDDADAPVVVTARSAHIDQARVLTVYTALSNSGVAGGDTKVVPKPEDVTVADGGATLIAARTGESWTLRAIDQPTAGLDTGDRARLIDAADSVFAAAPADGSAAWEALPVERWAVLTRPALSGGPDSEPSSWTGPPLESLHWTVGNNDIDCAIVTDADWPIGQDERLNAAGIRVAGRIVTRRPLLPHEAECADVLAWSDVIGKVRLPNAPYDHLS